jgi:hypothetical protein
VPGLLPAPLVGPTPSFGIAYLYAAGRAGIDLAQFCDQIADARAGSAVRESTAHMYNSHLRQIFRVCELLHACGLPASLATIRRVSSAVGNPSTLRRWLAAWRRLHCVARLRWEGDGDPFLLAVRTGLRQTLGPQLPKKRCQKQLLRTILQEAAARHWWEVGGLAVLAYTFGLRVPSELMRQAKAELFVCRGNRIVYGPIRRKGKQELQTLKRWCICASDKLLCPHLWLQVLTKARPSSLLFSKSLDELMTCIRRVLSDLKVPQPETYTSHCFRRGAGVDVLEAQGLQAMLSFSQWSSPQAARPYASADEQTAQALGSSMADFS